ncbi:carcinoembryonic antigen-related cell adhesion molecule 5-like [Anabas testudineus]|uniref:carcinoembryonic antigen-related cell adhesion molecule 5-like n=1 Tax=Anabas testudineus TaxID=64144 RepID=UPI000E465ABD|nr:carcinoembryonic antigen-related cell adhesion molecule 5-like [Anabas testudineus]
MDTLQVLCIVFVAFTGLTSGLGVLPDGPLTAAVGGTVMFNTTVTPPEKPFVFVGWIFILNNIDNNIISSTSGNTTGPAYEGRITLFRSTGSLELRNLSLNDSGEYRVTITPDGGVQVTGSTRLEILVPVSNVTITVSNTDLVEFNSSVNLSCSSSGSSLSFLWLNSSSGVAASDRVQLTDGNRNFTLINVTRYDQGPFRCRVFNPVSDGTSDPVNLFISYGPENINLKKSSSNENYVTGSNISLSCSADSKPSAQFKWFLNGSLLSDTGPELRLTNIQLNQSGNYICQAFNNKTLRYQTSEPSAVVVIVPVSNLTITVSNTDLVEFNSFVNLSCSSSGSSLSFLWMNGSSEVTASDRVQLTDGNSTLTIINVTRYDQGPFRCRAFNPVSNGTSDPVNLSISFGPDDIHLNKSSSNENYLKGSNIDLTCSADSKPSAQFKWFLNGSLLSDTGPKLRLTNIQKNQSGNYICQAFNNKTLRYRTSQPTAITVVEPQPPAGCSAGCIAGIVIACVVVAATCAVLLYYFYKKKKQKKLLSSKRDTPTRTGGEGQDNAAYSQSQVNVTTRQNHVTQKFCFHVKFI